MSVAEDASPRSALRLAMVGGGEGAFIGAIHRAAAAIDGEWRLVAGSFSSDLSRNRRSGLGIGLPPDRIYPTLEDMLRGELALAPSERADAVAIVTPNHLHAPMSIAALDAGFHVLCEKPMAFNVAEANAVAAAVRKSGLCYALAFTYAGYPLIAEARARIADGELGRVRLVQVEYSQGWLSRPIDRDGHRQAEWRTDPARAGLGGCLGDIGTHAFHLAELVSGQRVELLCADLTTHVADRLLDDDVSALLRFGGGATGMLRATQVAAGEENALKLRIHGERGGLEWDQQEPNSLILRSLDGPTRILRAGGPGVGAHATAMARTPAGHPEGYIEAFANIYRAFAANIRAGGASGPTMPGYSGIEDGLRTMSFIETMVASARSDIKWSPMG